MCKSLICHDKKLNPRITFCTKCNRHFYSKSCKFAHIKNKICERKKICKICDNLYVVKKTKPHKCYNIDYCKTCKIIHPPNRHFIRSGFSPPKNCKYLLIFDFETFNNKNKFVTPYLCVSRLYNIESLYSTVLVNLQTSDFTFEEKIFYGINCAKEFFFYLISGLVPKGTICFAHNGQSFDFYFILTYFYKHPYCAPSLVFNGSRLMQMVVKTEKIELKFIDSLNFIPFPLRKFPSIFGFSDQKSYFPYTFVDNNSIYYEGPVPDKTYYEIPANDMDSFDIFYNNELRKVQQSPSRKWNLQKVSTKYCVQDVHVLFCGIFHYLSNFYKVAKINPFT